MAVYTEVPDDELRAFVAQYDIGEVEGCKGIAEGVENSNFLLQTTRGNFILTLYEKRVNPADLPFFIALMEHLAVAGIACPTPVKARDGQSLRHLCHRPAAIVTFLQGLWPRRIDANHCAQLGEGLARMHLAGRSFAMARPNGLGLPSWRGLFESCRARADEVRPGLGGILDGEIDWLEAHWPEGLPQGIIHADLFPDNVFFKGASLSGFIDFYFACTDALAYDIAVCLNAWCFEADGALNVTKTRALLASYQTVRPLEAAEYEELPALARGAAMRFLLTRLYDWLNTPPGAFVKRKDPLEYLRKLSFHAAVSGPGAYGLSPAEASRA